MPYCILRVRSERREDRPQAAADALQVPSAAPQRGKGKQRREVPLAELQEILDHSLLGASGERTMVIDEIGERVEHVPPGDGPRPRVELYVRVMAVDLAGLPVGHGTVELVLDDDDEVIPVGDHAVVYSAALGVDDVARDDGGVRRPDDRDTRDPLLRRARAALEDPPLLRAEGWTVEGVQGEFGGDKSQPRLMCERAVAQHDQKGARQLVLVMGRKLLVRLKEVERIAHAQIVGAMAG
jgi:hypothetical protein